MTRILVSLALLAFLGVSSAQDENAAEDEQAQADRQDDQGRVRRLGDSLAIDPNQEWVPSFDSSAELDDIELKLAAAERSLQDGAYVSPPDANALYYFQQVLEIDADNVVALDGLGRVADALVAAARAAQAAGDRATAMARIEEVKSFRPTYPGLRTLEDEVSRRAEIDALLTDAAGRVSAGQLVSPADGSALAAYQSVLAIDPGNTTATAGIRDILDQTLAAARDAIASGSFADAEARLAEAATIPGSDGDVATVRGELSAAVRAGQEAELDAIEARVQDGDIDGAESALAALLDAGYPANQRTAEIDVEIARIRRLRDFPAGSTIEDGLSRGGDGPTMVVIPAGEFEMGARRNDRDREADEGPLTAVRFAVPFALSETEVTVADFRVFVEATGYVTDAEQGTGSTIYNVLAGSLKDDPEASWRNDFQGQPADDEDPVVHVSWNDAAAYAAWLAEETGESYRLPSESEFEYALRAGSDTPYWWGRGAPRDTVENLTGEEDRMAGRWEWPDPFERYGDDHWGPAPARTFEANPFGLYDMGGNVMEWVADCYRNTLEGIPTNGRPRTGDDGCSRVLKGGAFATPPARSRSAQRTSAQARRTTCLVGFRVARDL